MNVPGLPKTKARIIDRATSEGWAFEEVKGIGGTRRLYEVPSAYLLPQDLPPRATYVKRSPPAENTQAPHVPTIVSGAKADMERLTLAVQAVEEWCQETGRPLEPGQKGAVIAVLYDYLLRGGEEDNVRSLLKVVR